MNERSPNNVRPVVFSEFYKYKVRSGANLKSKFDGEFGVKENFSMFLKNQRKF